MCIYMYMYIYIYICIYIYVCIPTITLLYPIIPPCFSVLDHLFWWINCRKQNTPPFIISLPKICPSHYIIFQYVPCVFPICFPSFPQCFPWDFPGSPRPPQVKHLPPHQRRSIWSTAVARHTVAACEASGTPRMAEISLENINRFGTWISFLHIWEFHHPNWLSYFPEGLKPPTSTYTYI